jgi:hypothetical protein
MIHIVFTAFIYHESYLYPCKLSHIHCIQMLVRCMFSGGSGDNCYIHDGEIYTISDNKVSCVSILVVSAHHGLVCTIVLSATGGDGYIQCGES